MKIICVINSSNNGGAQKMIVALYKELLLRFPETKLVFLQKIDSQYSDIDNAFYFNRKMKSPKDYWKAYVKLKTLIKTERPDVLISFLPLANIMSSILGKKMGVRYRIVSQRNPPFIYGRIVRFIDRIIGSRGYYTHNVCNSKAGFDAFSHYPISYREQMSIINNCVEKPDFTLSKDEARDKLGIGSDVVVLTCVGRLHDQKNHELIIDAMKFVEKGKLLLGGDGPLRNKIESQIRNNGLQEKVMMLGDLNREDVRYLLRASDIFLIPSKYEGLSNALIEAMSYGLPIVCSDIPSFTDFLRAKDGIDGFSGMIISNDSKQWAIGIDNLVSDENLRYSYQELSFKHVSDLTAGKMTDKFVALFEHN